VDFDGVIHDYKGGWQGGKIYGNVTDGFFDWVRQVMPLFRIVVYSSRSKDAGMIDAMRDWLGQQAVLNNTTVPDGIEFSHEKPPAYLTIDDRALTFNGDWSEFPPSRLLDFRPWMMK
jgi:hypothetical protein